MEKGKWVCETKVTTGKGGAGFMAIICLLHVDVHSYTRRKVQEDKAKRVSGDWAYPDST